MAEKKYALFQRYTVRVRATEENPEGIAWSEWFERNYGTFYDTEKEAKEAINIAKEETKDVNRITKSKREFKYELVDPDDYKIPDTIVIR